MEDLFKNQGMALFGLPNTSVKRGGATHVEPHLHSYLRNNLYIGGGQGAEAVTSRGRIPAFLDFDYDGYGVIGAPYRGNLAGKEFNSERTLRSATMERHGVRVDLEIFAKRVVIPEDLFPEQRPPDLRLRPGSAAVDAGIPLPNINDAFSGVAPDLGAYELGKKLPFYGPRPK